jgi:hypothetical protein
VSRQAPPIHGKDHLPGAADPIGFEQTWPTFHQFDPWTEVESAGDHSGWVRTIDTACYKNGFISNSGSDGDYVIWPVRLGPLGSIWQVLMVVNTRTDAGILKFAFASAGDDYYYPGGYQLQADATFHDLGTGQSLYNGTPAKNFTQNTDIFRINGVDGTDLTSISGSDAEVPAAKIFNGGAGLYLFRVKVDGKEVASSSYYAEISHLALVRLSV